MSKTDEEKAAEAEEKKRFDDAVAAKLREEEDKKTAAKVKAEADAKIEAKVKAKAEKAAKEEAEAAAKKTAEDAEAAKRGGVTVERTDDKALADLKAMVDDLAKSDKSKDDVIKEIQEAFKSLTKGSSPLAKLLRTKIGNSPTLLG